MSKVILVVGNDKIGRKALHLLQSTEDLSKFSILIDNSSDIKRVLRLVRKGIIKLSWVWEMLIADLKRSEIKLNKYNSISSNKDLLQHLTQETVVVLFRAGLIINKQAISSAKDILNIHCAKVPDFGGLGAIRRALDAAAYSQCATLHRVVERIDAGEVIDTESYTLRPETSYFENEEIAYSAGIRLLARTLKGLSHDL